MNNPKVIKNKATRNPRIVIRRSDRSLFNRHWSSHIPIKYHRITTPKKKDRSSKP